MIDVHSHVLPGMDDGSKNTDESLAMLHLLKKQGVSRVVATPHFYGNQNDPESFLRRREASWERLKRRLDGDCPDICPGAEVYYFEGIARTDEVRKLCIQGTNVLLLEMPFSSWSMRMVEEVLRLRETMDLTVVIAHVERYLFSQRKEIREAVFSSPLLLQVNAGYFLDWRTRRRALRQLKDGIVHLIGSDCHGIERRPPRMDEAAEQIRKHLGEETMRKLERDSSMLLDGAAW